MPRSLSPEAVRNPQAMRNPRAADPNEREQRLLEQIGELRNDGGCGGVADLPDLEGPNRRTAFPQARPRVRSRDIEQPLLAPSVSVTATGTSRYFAWKAIGTGSVRRGTQLSVAPFGGPT